MGIALEQGSPIAVIGGGPAGSLFAYFCLTFAERADLALRVDIYEPRDFEKLGPAGCNMCGGIVSESLVQALAVEGINLPSQIVQRGIDSYVLHTDDESLKIETPYHEKRIASLHRGGGPRDTAFLKWGGLDGYLLDLAQARGAKRIARRVLDVRCDSVRPQICLDEGVETYDLVVGATGVNSTGWPLFERLGITSKPPITTKTFVTEVHLGTNVIAERFGDSMHMFLLDIPGLDCAAMIPKGDFVTICLLGRDMDRDLVRAFFASPAVKRCFPSTVDAAPGACHCSPKINVGEATRPFADRVVLVGDCGVSRLYKDGIGAAFRTAKAAARTAVFDGVAAMDFERHYWPTYRRIAHDNRFGRILFAVVHWIRAMSPLLRGVMRMAALEQASPGPDRRMSIVLWDMFTGSAPYRDIFLRTLDPRFLGRFAWECGVSAMGSPGRPR